MNAFYVSDLDGTLLQDDATLSPWSKESLGTLLDKGLRFTVASARSIASIRTILDGLSFHLPIIEFNGAFISDLASGQHLIVNDLAQTVVEDVYRLAGEAGHVPFVSTFSGDEDRLYYRDVLNAGMRWYVRDCQTRGDRRLRHIDDLRHTFQERVVCLTVIGQAEPLADLERAVNDGHANAVETHLFENRYSPGWYWLTVHDRQATKDQAIRIVQREWGLDHSELVVFGDGSNDIKMFQAARRAIAVGNAIAELKAIATEVIGTNREDSVVRYIHTEWYAGSRW